MNIISDEGENTGPDIDMGLSDSDDVTAVMAENSSSSSSSSSRTAAGRRTRRRSQSFDGRSSFSHVNKRKYPANHKHIPFRSHSPTSAPKYQGNYWIRIRPVAAPRNSTVIYSHATQAEHSPAAPFKERRVASMEEDNFFRMDDEDIFRLSTVRGVAKSSSFDDIMDLHAPPSPPISSFNSCQRWQPGGTNININPKYSRIFFGSSGRPVIRPKNGHVR